MGKTIRIVAVAPEQDRCQNLPWNRDFALRQRQSAQRAAARNRDAKAYRESDADLVGQIIQMPLTD